MVRSNVAIQRPEETMITLYGRVTDKEGSGYGKKD
jgi:hypothetical protein